jgi:hypothetical protein
MHIGRNISSLAKVTQVSDVDHGPLVFSCGVQDKEKENSLWLKTGQKEGKFRSQIKILFLF